jgi:hypothetical protein
MSTVDIIIESARACVGLGLAAALAGGCGADQTDPVLDSTPLGELSPAQKKSLCNELRDARESQPSESCLPAEVGYALIAANPVPCAELQAWPCDATAGEVRACERAQRADVCHNGHEATAACAPWTQRGCAAEDPAFAWTDSCPDLAASVAPFEGIYALSRHTVNDTGCEAEGASVLETDAQRMFVVVTLQLHGAPIGRIERCEDLEHCREVGDALRRYSQRSPAPSDPDEPFDRDLVCHPTIEGALQSQVAWAESAAKEGLCHFEQTEEIITRAPDGTLHLETRSRAWQTPLEDTSCELLRPDGPVPAGVDCSRLQVYEARLVSTL